MKKAQISVATAHYLCLISKFTFFKENLLTFQSAETLVPFSGEHRAKNTKLNKISRKIIGKTVFISDN